MKYKVPIIIGPTAVGKTDLSLLLAKEKGGEIVSADSRQLFRYMDIGTAKVSAQALEEIPHHFINILDPDEYYSAGIFAKEARRTIKEIQARGRLPIVVGGSGLYIQALIDGIFEREAKDPDIRKNLEARVNNEGLNILYSELEQIDPDYAAKLSVNDKQRILRALEVTIITKRPFSEWHLQKSTPADFDPLFIGLNSDRFILYKRINERVEQMFANGLEDEVKRIDKMGFSRNLNALNTVGYKEVFAYLNAEISREEMIEQIKRNSRRYAKRQLTWFKKNKRIHWFQLQDRQDLSGILNATLKLLNS